MNHVTEDQLILYYYGETAEIEPHLDGCAECREAYQGLQRVLNSLDAAPVPERGPEYGRQVWQQIQPNLGRRRFNWKPVWALAAAAAVLVGAFVAGTRYERSGKVAPAVAKVEDTRQRVLRVALDGHLASSLMVLSEIQNAPATGKVDIAWQQQSAEQLLDDNRLYKQTAESTQEARVTQLLGDLEQILLEIAHSPAQLNPQQLDALRRRIAQKGIVFEIRVLAAEPSYDKGIL